MRRFGGVLECSLGGLDVNWVSFENEKNVEIIIFKVEKN